MFLTGFADYAADSLAVQIKASRKLNWHFIETRFIDKKSR